MQWQDKVGQELVSALRATLAQTGRNASKQTSDSLRYDYSGNEIRLWGIETYFYTENGRRAGQLPPVEVILQWTIDKGITPDNGDRVGLAWAISKKIAAEGVPVKGSPANGNMQPLEKTLDAVLPNLLRIAQEGIAEDVRQRVFNMVKAVNRA